MNYYYYYYYYYKVEKWKPNGETSQHNCSLCSNDPVLSKGSPTICCVHFANL